MQVESRWLMMTLTPDVMQFSFAYICGAGGVGGQNSLPLCIGYLTFLVVGSQHRFRHFDIHRLCDLCCYVLLSA